MGIYRKEPWLIAKVLSHLIRHQKRAAAKQSLRLFHDIDYPKTTHVLYARGAVGITTHRPSSQVQQKDTQYYTHLPPISLFDFRLTYFICCGCTGTICALVQPEEGIKSESIVSNTDNIIVRFPSNIFYLLWLHRHNLCWE